MEAVSIDDRRKIKHFIEAQTPPEMQFLLTSRNSEEYESNTRLCGFESEDGKTFVHSYIEWIKGRFFMCECVEGHTKKYGRVAAKRL